MALPYLKIEPEQALQILDECIVSGYQIKDKINEEYFANKDKVAQFISTWRLSANEWADRTRQKISGVFVSQKELYNFRDAPLSPLMRSNTNVDWNAIINQITARINKLNEYDKDIHSRFNIKFEVIGRDKIVQNGVEGKITISN